MCGSRQVNADERGSNKADPSHPDQWRPLSWEHHLPAGHLGGARAPVDHILRFNLLRRQPFYGRQIKCMAVSEQAQAASWARKTGEPLPACPTERSEDGAAYR